MNRLSIVCREWKSDEVTGSESMCSAVVVDLIAFIGVNLRDRFRLNSGNKFKFVPSADSIAHECRSVVRLDCAKQTLSPSRWLSVFGSCPAYGDTEQR